MSTKEEPDSSDTPQRQQMKLYAENRAGDEWPADVEELPDVDEFIEIGNCRML